MKKELLEKIIIIRISYSPWVVYQAILPGAHTPLTEVSTPILTVVSLQYFPGCFLLAFLEGRYSSLFLEVTSLCLDPTTWNPSVLSKRVASSSSTLFWSCWRYSNVLFFFSSSQLPSLFSELHIQPKVTLLLLPVGSWAAAPSCVSATSLVIAFQAHQYCFEKFWRGWGKIW